METKGRICAIVAMDEARVIGVNNTLPWRIPEDLKRFSTLTKGHTVLMGRKTYESLPPKFRPLPDRVNMVLSRDVGFEGGLGVVRCSSLDEAIQRWEQRQGPGVGDRLWIIGGADVYRQGLPRVQELYLTRVHGTHQGDAFFPSFEGEFSLQGREDHPGFSFEHYVRSAGGAISGPP